MDAVVHTIVRCNLNHLITGVDQFRERMLFDLCIGFFTDMCRIASRIGCESMVVRRMMLTVID